MAYNVLSHYPKKRVQFQHYCGMLTEDWQVSYGTVGEGQVLRLRVGCQLHNVENWLAFAGDMKALWDEVRWDYVYYKSLTEWIVEEIGSRYPESYSKEWEVHLPYLDEETKRLEEYIRNLLKEEDEND